MIIAPSLLAADFTRLGKEAQKLLDMSKEHFDEALDAAGNVVKSANKAAKTVSKLV